MKNKYVWIENGGQVDKVYLDQFFFMNPSVDLSDIDFVYNFKSLGNGHGFNKISNYENIISCSVYTGDSHEQLWRILHIFGTYNLKGINYYSLTGDRLCKALNQLPRFMNFTPEVIKCVSNNYLYECTFKSIDRVLFDPLDSTFKTQL